MTLPPLVDLVVEPLRRFFRRREATSDVRSRVDLQLITCEPVSDPGLEVTPARAAALLVAEETDGASAP